MYVPIFSGSIVGDNVFPGLVGDYKFQILTNLLGNMRPIIPLTGHFIRIGQNKSGISGCLHNTLKFRRTCLILAICNADDQIAAVCNMTAAPKGFIIRVCHNHQMLCMRQIQIGQIRIG